MSEIRFPRIRRVVPTLLVLLALAGGGPSAQGTAPPPERLTFSHLLPADGLPSVQLRRIIQDRQGFMWFATYEGLLRFDSREFRTFRHDAADPHSLSNNTTWDLAEDADGNLWVGSDGGLDLWRRDREHFTPIGKTGDDHHRLSSPFVRRLILDGDDGLWIGTFGGGLNRLDRRTGRVQVHRARPAEPDALADDYILDLFRDSRGTLWIGTQSAGLVAFDPATRRFRTFRHDPADPRSLPGARVSAIGEDAQGSLWVGTTGGLSRLGRDRRTFEHFPFVAGDPAALQGSKVDAIVRDRDGSMWFGTDGGGLSRFVPATRSFVHFRHVRGDPTTPVSNVVPAFYQDRAGDYWVGHWPWGVSYANRLNASVQLVRTIPGQPATIPDDTIHALLEDPSGDLLAGTDHAGLCRFDARARTWRSYLPPPVPGQPVARAVMTIARDDAGRIWAGTWRGGVRRIDPGTGRVTPFRADPGRPNALSSDFVLSVVRDRLGRMWVSTFGGGVNRYVPELDGFVHYRHDPANPRTLSHDGVGCLMVARDGALWAGSQAGLARWDAARDDWERVECAADHPGTLAGNFVNDILEAPDGNLWVATAGGGLNHVDLATRRCRAFGVRDGLPTTVIRSLIADDRGALWLGTTEGLAVFDPATTRVRVFDESNGIHGRVFNRGARWRLSDGRLMMGGAGGFEIFDPRRMGPDDTVPPVVLTGLEILNQPVKPAAGSILDRSITLASRIDVPSRAAVISLRFAALSYRSSARTRIEYLLEGFDREWRASGPERRATYTNLSPGTYRFRVRAANGEGVWSGSGVALELVVVPAWWQTWWFRGGLLAGVAGLLVAGTVTMSRRRYRAQLLAARRETERALERQRASDVIRESEERLQMALKGGDLGTWDWDVASGHVVFSPQSAGMIGYADGELPPHHQAWRDHIHPDDLEPTVRAIEAHLRGESPNYESEYRIRHKDGHWVWILARGRVIGRAADGAPVRVSGTHLDVTARRQGEEQRRTLEALLAQSQKMESVGRLAGGVAHDLNNMLTPILGYCELLNMELAPDDPQRSGMQEIKRAAERSRDLVGQLLAFARKQTLEMKHLDLNEVVRDFATMLRRTLRENIAIDYDLAADLPAVRGDAVQLQQILLNLSMNAQDAMPDGGRLFIETRVQAAFGDDPLDGVPSGRYVVLTVSDTGAGMDEATRQRVFEPFFTTKDLGRGTGLGLATVHGIVQQHDGFIQVDSDAGRGTIFTVHFVAQDGPAIAAMPERSPAASGDADETVLIVEDQARVRELCMLVLARAGYTVLAAASAADALERSARHAGPIDLLLTDVVLPDVNGRVLYEQLARRRPTIRVLYMSGHTTDVITHHGVLDDGVNYLQKPFDGETLTAKIRQVLDAEAVGMERDDERR